MEEILTGTVLNVNDNDAGRYGTTRILRKAGFQVMEASTGEEALSLVRQNPDVVILDVSLPDLHGLEVCRRIKSDPASSTVMVLHLSAIYVRSEDRVIGLEGGADGYLSQPVEPPELIATVRSLLRLRRAEASVRSDAEQWQATFASISDGVCVLDAGGTVLRCNAAGAALLGVSTARELVGQRIDDLIRSRFGPHPLSPESSNANGRTSWEARHEQRWVRITRDPLRGPTGEPEGSVYIFSDVTERKQLEAELRDRAEALAEANQRKNEFLAMLAHELRNPLGAISNALSVLNRIGTEDQTVLRQFGTVERQLRHLTRLVDDLLDVSRITHGKTELRLRKIEIHPVIQQVMSTCRARLEERGHQFALTIAGTQLWLEADPTRLEQIIGNLLDNAAKYTEPGGRVELSVEQEAGNTPDRPGMLALRVRDTGIGISAEMLPHVFDLFAQADQSLERARGGLGIGLTLVRRLVEMHGGTIAAASAGPGLGSEFTVRLPLVSAPGAAHGGTDSPNPGPDSHSTDSEQSRLVVIVEDNRDARETLRDLLEIQGHRVKTADNGRDGVELILNSRPDIAFVDIGLPGLDGYEVARLLRDAATGKRVRLIALTGYGQPEDRLRALEAGFDAHLVKPVEPERMLELLGEA